MILTLFIEKIYGRMHCIHEHFYHISSPRPLRDSIFTEVAYSLGVILVTFLKWREK